MLGSCVRLMLDSYVIRRDKWVKKLRSYCVQNYIAWNDIELRQVGGCVRLTLGNDAMKPCKWDQKIMQ